MPQLEILLRVKTSRAHQQEAAGRLNTACERSIHQ
jgi:hypothetical protein